MQNSSPSLSEVNKLCADSRLLNDVLMNKLINCRYIKEVDYTVKASVTFELFHELLLNRVVFNSNNNYLRWATILPATEKLRMHG